MKKKILLLSQFFYPDKSGTGKVLAELFQGLPQEKFDIDVISGRTIYNDKSKAILLKHEKVGNITIHRVLKHFMPKEKAWGRLFNYIVFFLMASLKVIISQLYRDKDIIFSVSNPPIMPLLGAILKNNRNKFIYLIHDLYPDVAIKLGFVKETNIMAKIMRSINKFVFSKADKIIVLGRDMKDYLIENYLVKSDKIEVFTNWSSSLPISGSLDKRQSDELQCLRILYTGNIGNAHNLEIAVRAAIELKDIIELVIVGEGVKKKKLKQLAAEAKNIRFLPYLNDNEYFNMLESADFLLLSLEKGLSGIVIPSKFYTYLAACKPIIAISDSSSEIALTIREERCGLVFGHDDLDVFVENIKNLSFNKVQYQVMCTNAKDAFETKYEKSVIIEQYSKFFDRITSL